MDNIDFVITYVDGSDPKWLAKKRKYENPLEANVNRYRSWDNLKYWFRSVEKYAPWVHKIYFITDNQIPSWLNTDNDKLVIINHQDYLDKKDLPTFNSNAIELKMHLIENLSNQFVYFNDDFFLTDNVTPLDFFSNGLPKDNYGEKLFVSDDLSSFNHIMLNNISTINQHFNKKDVYKKNKSKYFNFLYFKDSLKTLYLRPFKKFMNFNNPHICLSLLKTTFEEVWENNEDILTKTCSSKFRTNEDVNIFLMRYYQLLTGRFLPRSCHFGHYFSMKDYQKAIEAIKKQTYKCICINDDSNTDFEHIKEEINQAFACKFKDSSSFER